MKAFITLIVIAALIGIGLLLWPKAMPEPEVPTDTDTSTEATSPLSSLAWRFEEFTKDELPYTRIFLDTTYGSEIAASQTVDEAFGSCNAIDPANEDTDMVPGSEKIQCYGAGLGHWYKIVKGEDAYHVQRKIFEEASPDYDPPEYDYETIAKFPLMQ